MTARQPGIAFVSPATSVTEALPRMDIACFVGFAARGPVHEPVAVDSAEQYLRIFGSDLPLVWDAENGELLHAHLGPAVRAFFTNGGRRAWVIRVAEAPRSNRFPVPGLCRVTASGRLLPAHLTAASPGSWSDGLRVASSIDQLPLVLLAANLHDGCLRLDLRTREALQDGDLLQAEWDDADGGRIAFCPYSGAQAIAWNNIRWFRRATLPSRAREGYGRLYRAGYRHRFPLRVSPQWTGDRPVVEIDLPPDHAPQPGETLKVYLGSAEYWLLVEQCQPHAADTLRLAGRGLRRLTLPPTAWPGPPARLTRQRLNLHIDERHDESQRPSSTLARLNGLGFCDRHPNALVNLAGDTLVWRSDAATALRDGIHFVPLVSDILASPARGATPLAESRLTRDGLKQFGAHLFLDPALATQRTPQLADAADRIRFTGVSTRPLRGLHAAFGLEEATLLCVPDAVHRPWQRVPGADYPTPAPSTPIPPPANVCAVEVQADSFSPGLPRKLPAPALAADPADAQGAVRLFWSGGPTAAQYILEEARDRGWLDTAEIHRGPAREYTLRDRLHGDYFYRLRCETADSYSDWSAGLSVRTDPSAGWKVDEAADYRDTDLLAIQRALVRLAAARGDCLAVLALPRHYRRHLAIDHVRRLKDETPAFFDIEETGTIDVPPLSAGEAASWSYAALYHPWLRRLDAAADTALPPDGPATGVIARRTLARGAWIAPARQMLNGVAALDSVLAPDDAQLAAAINPIGRDGLNFNVLDALTLSNDADTQPINVRRLLSLLRRLALKQGALFVFEANSDTLRRAIDNRFRHWLDTLFARGAFAGNSAREAYRLRVDRSVNTAQSIDAGRLIIEIAVAPAQPLRFLTVRLVQSADRGEHFSVTEA